MALSVIWHPLMESPWRLKVNQKNYVSMSLFKKKDFKPKSCSLLIIQIASKIPKEEFYFGKQYTLILIYELCALNKSATNIDRW